LISFTGTVTDEDVDLAESLEWTSDLSGQVGTGGSVEASLTVVGTHTITASVTDSGGEKGSTSIEIKVEAAPDGTDTGTVTLTANSTNEGKTWTAIVEGATIGTWDYPSPDGTVASCTDGGTCTLSGIAKKEASVRFTADDGRTVTVAKP
jgi:hypothetical protein